jgi:hypothetical protein
MELGREGLEISVLGKITSCLCELPLSLRLQVNFRRTKRVFLCYKVIFVDSF